MKFSFKSSGYSWTASIIVALFIALLVLLGGFCWQYTINTILAFFGRPPVVELWQGCLVGLVPFLGQVSIPAAVITWIVSLILGV